MTGSSGVPSTYSTVATAANEAPSRRVAAAWNQRHPQRREHRGGQLPEVLDDRERASNRPSAAGR
jgi:hypothetical protein